MVLRDVSRFPRIQWSSTLPSLRGEYAADVKARDRAILDEKSGDLGSARRRLMSRASSSDYDPRLCEQIARICVKMSDPKEAGRWYFLSDSDDPESPACIAKFLEQFNRAPKQTIQQIPSNLRLESVDRYPPVVGERLRAAEFRGVARSPRPDRRSPSETWSQKLRRMGCLLVVAVLVIVVVAIFVGGLAFFAELFERR